MPDQILVLGGSVLGPSFWGEFCSYAKKEDGAEAHVVTFSDVNAEAYREHSDVFTTVESQERLLNSYGEDEVDTSEVKSFIRNFEEQTGILFTELLQSDRHLGRGYFTTGRRHPYSNLAKRRNYWDSAQLVKTYIGAFDRLFEDIDPDVLLLGSVASLPTKLLCVYARQHGTEIRYLKTARIGNRYLWGVNEFVDLPQLTESYENTAPVTDEELVEMAEPYDLHKKVVDRHENHFSAVGAFSLLFSQISGYMRDNIKQIIDGRKKPSTYKLLSRVKYTKNKYWEHKKLMRLVENQDRLLGEEYIFFPLQTEPEASLIIKSPAFNKQEAYIYALSQGLPAGYTLLVKEHVPAIGRRPQGFYEWLDDLPNVALASPYQQGVRLAQNSLATATVSSTAGLEAAVAGVPVVTSGTHNSFNIMDHVYQTTDFSEVRSIIMEIVREYESETSQQKARQAEGRRFFNALDSISVDLGSESLYDGMSPTNNSVKLLYENLLWTIDNYSTQEANEKDNRRSVLG